MAQNDLLKRYLDAGMQFTQMTQQRAEAIVRDLVKTGEVRTEQAQGVVNDLVDRSRKNTERLLDLVRTEVRNQIAVLDLVTKDVVQRLEKQIDQLREQLPVPGRPKKTPAKKVPAKKAPAKKKAAAKKAPAKKKAAAKKAPAKKAAAKRTAESPAS